MVFSTEDIGDVELTDAGLLHPLAIITETVSAGAGTGGVRDRKGKKRTSSSFAKSSQATKRLRRFPSPGSDPMGNESVSMRHLCVATASVCSHP